MRVAALLLLLGHARTLMPCPSDSEFRINCDSEFRTTCPSDGILGTHGVEACCASSCGETAPSTPTLVSNHECNLDYRKYYWGSASPDTPSPDTPLLASRSLCASGTGDGVRERRSGDGVRDFAFASRAASAIFCTIRSFSSL